MRYISSIPVYSKIHDFGIKGDKFFLDNSEAGDHREWECLPLNTRKVENYVELASMARKRLFLVVDDRNSQTWVCVQSKTRSLIINAPWRKILEHLRVNIVDLKQGDYLVKNMTGNYHLGLGNFYLYPELNPMNLPLINHGEVKTLSQILETVSEVYPLDENNTNIPLGKVGRFNKGLIVSGGHLWWFDRRAKLAYYLNEYFFEGGISYKRSKEQDTVLDTGYVPLPKSVDGKWVSPKLPENYIGNLITPDVEIIPAGGTRITPITKADKNTCGEYVIAGYGTFGQVDLPDRLIAFIRTKLGSCLSLEIRGDRFIAIYNISDIKSLYIRENPNWKEPVIKSPMADDIQESDIVVTEPVQLTVFQKPEVKKEEPVYGPAYLLGTEPKPEEEPPLKQLVSDLDITHMYQAQVGLLDLGNAAEATPEGKSLDAPVTTSEMLGNSEIVVQMHNAIPGNGAGTDWSISSEPVHEGFLGMAGLNPFPRYSDPSRLEMAGSTTPTVDLGEENYIDQKGMQELEVAKLFEGPVIDYISVENVKELNLRQMLIGSIWVMDLPEPYGSLVPWYQLASRDCYDLEEGDLVTGANLSIIRIGDRLYRADMHLNF